MSIATSFTSLIATLASSSSSSSSAAAARRRRPTDFSETDGRTRTVDWSVALAVVNVGVVVSKLSHVFLEGINPARSLARSFAPLETDGGRTAGRTDERSGREDDHLIRDEMPTARPCQPAASHYINSDRRTDGRMDGGPSEPPPLPSSLSPSSHRSSGEKGREGEEGVNALRRFLPSFLPSLPSDGRLASQQREVFSAELYVVLCCVVL